MPNIEERKPEFDTEEHFLSPQDAFKTKILERWLAVEDAFSRGENDFFINGSRALVRMVKLLLTDEQIESLMKIRKNEEMACQRIRQRQMPTDTKERELKATRLKFSEEVMENMAPYLLGSGFIDRDSIVTFDTPETIQEIEELGALMRSPMPKHAKNFVSVIE